MNDLNRADFSTRPETELSKRLSDLNREDFSERSEVTVKCTVRLVEQERGFELQINVPEFTLTTMFPIVIVIEAARVLKIEVFSAKLEAEVKELARDLKREDTLARLDTELSESLRPFARRLVSNV